MSSSFDIPELDTKGLRGFALTTGAIVAVLFGLLFPWLFDFPVPWWPWVIGAVLSAWGIAAPDSLRPVYRGWMRFGMLLGRVTTPVIMGAIFFLVILPFALALKVLRRDFLERRFDPQAPTYRSISRKPEKDNLERPF